jgi:hypothetical protein
MTQGTSAHLLALPPLPFSHRHLPDSVTSSSLPRPVSRLTTSSLLIAISWKQAHTRLVLVDRTISTHPHIHQTYQTAINRSVSVSQQPNLKSRWPTFSYPYPSPPPEKRPTSSYQEEGAGYSDMEIARKIPLPPSPPPSPVLGFKQLR